MMWVWVLIALGGLAGGLLGWQGFVLQMLLYAVLGAFALGRRWERRKIKREIMRAHLERFCAWAERELAAAPDELEPEEEERQRSLQGDYHAAHELLRELRPR